MEADSAMPQLIEPSLRVLVIPFPANALREESVRAVGEQYERAGGQTLHLDLSVVEFPTAGGLGGLVTLRQRVRARGGRLALLNASRPVYEVFLLSRLHELLDVRPR
jgi:anti-anti-sigma factor